MSDTDQPCCPGLERGQIIPAFELPGADGMPHSPWDYKQREHLLLLFLSDPASKSTQDMLRNYKQYYPQFREERCAILMISSKPVISNLQTQEELHLPFPLLSDTQGKVIPQYTRWEGATRRLTPTVILADRYSALYQQWQAEDETALPPINELLKTLQYLNTLCTP
jgi:peroxiredoxin